MQAAQLDGDMLKKVNMVLGGVFGGGPGGEGGPRESGKAPTSLKETVSQIEKLGFKVKR